jgi:hypothetical protein
MMEEYIVFDESDAEFVLTLPSEVEKFKKQIMKDILEQFSFEPRNEETRLKMNRFVAEWIKNQNSNI